MRRHLPRGGAGGRGAPRHILCSSQRQPVSVPQRHRVCVPQTHRVSVPQRHTVSVRQRHTVSVRQRHTVSVPDRPAKKIDFRVESAGVRDETWWKFRAMPGEFLRQNQQIQYQQSILIMDPEEEAKFEKSFRGPKLGLQSSVRGGVWTV